MKGSLHFVPGTNAQPAEWIITTTPDVTMRLKRIFPRMVQSKSTVLRLAETDEIANELEWTLIRFPMTMTPEDTARLTGRAELHRKKQAALELLMSAPPAPSQFQLAHPLRDYQSLGTMLYLAQMWLLLADEVGLGKSATAIASLTDKRTLPALVVVKAHLQKQWAAEVKKFLPNATTHIIKKNAQYLLPPVDVYIISYSKLSSWWGFLCKKVKSVIYDEVQELRRQESKRYEAAELLNSEVPFCIGLSATPIYNYGAEIWNVINVLRKGILGTFNEFTTEWCEMKYGKWMVTDPDALGHYLRSSKMMLRRTRKEIGRELPPVIRYIQDAEFDAKVYENGMSSADALARIILNGSFTERGEAARKFDLEMRQTTGIAKAPFVAELIRMLVDSGEKVLVAGWHRAVYEVWKNRLYDLRPAFFTGTESANQKEMSKRDFIEGRTNILCMSLRSGDGINGLQDVCSTVVFGEMDWSPKVHDQFIGRLARDGQTASVQVFFPVAPIGSDPTMAAVLGLKSAQSAGILDLGADVSSDLVDTDPQRVRQLAIDYLKSRGLTAHPATN